ncbi:xanthine dehydrogenase YagS FAD-binding subunit [Nocardioides daedukensis]|uniref:Xanthine dehydrogenase YagS FAD-binding subunit n=1 Tax=Nocardioides daedukensis TaxID=634462 RepID=A0A7Y9RZE6_9ACTN|nr:xanthine dehydrogenase family protein subunit M [Nocardioides daedukensis]NYG59466.1 xanthine dehydrogenase YagS FAD-binding subunit [Nocardioides daedukensis]
MREFDYVLATSPAHAVETVAGNPDARFLGGGTNLVDHLKLGVTSPDTLVDVSRLPFDEIEECSDGAGLRIGTNVPNSDLAAHPVIRSRFPAVARALLAGASGQIRNQATTGGNLLQRTRCVYFQDVTTPCNKRELGSGCSALEGYGRYNAILGASSDCVATHPSDLAVALAALDAAVVVQDGRGRRRVPIEELHRLPGDRPDLDTTLEHGDLIVAIELPYSQIATRSTYRKVRDRASFAFALVSVAAAIEMDGDRVGDVRIAWGGVAHKPWRAHRAEAELIGRPLTEEAVRAAVDVELADARTGEESAYKIPMLRNTTAVTLTRLAQEAR